MSQKGVNFYENNSRDKKQINKLTSEGKPRANRLSVLTNQNARFDKAMLYSYVHKENRVFDKFYQPEIFATRDESLPKENR